MKKSIWNIKIPTYYGMLMLVFVLGMTIFLIQKNILINIRALPSHIPNDLSITNITDQSFSISYFTSDTATGSISYGENEQANRVVLDSRDNTGNVSAHKQHYFTIQNLKPNTLYYFSILSNNNQYDNKGVPFKVTTGPTLGSNSQTPKTINGKLLLPDGSIPNEAIAFLRINGSQTLSTPLQKDGTYAFDLTNLRSSALSQYYLIADSDTLNLTFIGDGRQASATLIAKDSAKVPTVTLTQAYTFTADSPPVPTSSQTTPLNLPQFSADQAGKKLDIIIPEVNHEFDDRQPEFSGTAIPGKQIALIINLSNIDKTINETLTADNNGRWSYRVTEPLVPGSHVLTASSEAQSGGTDVITRTFIVNAQGSQFTDPSVAPSKTPTPVLSPILPTSTPAATITIVPTLTTYPTPTLIPPTDTPIPTAMITTTYPSPAPSIAPPGSNELFVSVGLMTFAAIVSALLFFLIRI